MARVGRLAGAILVESEKNYFLVGDLKQPCDFAAALVAYGVCETMFGNWGTTLVRDGGTPATTANYALAAFWAAVSPG